MTSRDSLLIGVDGGGTSCRLALVAGGRRHDVQLGPANASTGFEAAVATLHEALASAAVRAGLTLADLSAATAHFGLAGVMNAEIAGRVAERMRFRSLAVTDDRPTTLTGALGGSDGTVAAIGTGSFVGRQSDGQISGIGGWGFYLGDQASGAWLLRRCLEQVMLAVDGLAPKTALVRAILAAHGDDPGRIVQFSLTARPADYATLAGQVIEAADRGDDLGRALMDEGTRYIRSAMDTLGWKPGEVLCLTGGLGPAYGARLGVPVTPARGTALDGALILARRAAEGGT